MLKRTVTRPFKLFGTDGEPLSVTDIRQSDQDAVINFTYADPSHNWFQKAIIYTIEGLTGQPRLKRLYLDYQKENRPHSEFFAAAIERLEITVDYDHDKLKGLPAEGPLVVVANHPFGVVDGLMIGWLTSQVRPDFKILTNAVLCQAPELQHCLLPVDFSGTPEALAINLETRKAARQLLKDGGTVVVFPAGAVANAPTLLARHAVDWDWQPFTSHLIRQGRASVAPLFFHGQNSRAFQIASNLSPVLRLGLLFNEVRRLMGKTMKVSIGTPIPFEALQAYENRKDLARFLQEETYAVGRQEHLLGEKPL